jgi:hypothetical protein
MGSFCDSKPSMAAVMISFVSFGIGTWSLLSFWHELSQWAKISDRD